LHPDFLDCPAEGWLKGLSIRQLAEWEAYYSVEPFGDVREDWRQAIAGAGVMTMLKAGGEAVNPKRLLAVQAPKKQDANIRARLLEAKMKSFAAMTQRKEHGRDNR
jgi:hypothetical protein